MVHGPNMTSGSNQSGGQSSRSWAIHRPIRSHGGQSGATCIGTSYTYYGVLVAVGTHTSYTHLPLLRSTTRADKGIPRSWIIVKEYIEMNRIITDKINHNTYVLHNHSHVSEQTFTRSSLPSPLLLKANCPPTPPRHPSPTPASPHRLLVVQPPVPST